MFFFFNFQKISKSQTAVYFCPFFLRKNTGIRGGTEILPGVRVLLGGVKYFVGSFKKKIRKN